MATVESGYVLTETGEILVQVPDDNPWGFALLDDDQQWPGGFGVAGEWQLLPGDDPRITAEIRERLGWLLD